MSSTLIEAPKRIQLQRTKGYRKPEGAVRVARPGKWGNPFRYGDYTGLKRVPAAIDEGAAWEYEGRISADGASHAYHHPDGRITHCTVFYMTYEEIVETFRRALLGDPSPSMRSAAPTAKWLKFTIEDVQRELRGKDLACYCPLDRPCHGDVLLEVANETVHLIADGEAVTSCCGVTPFELPRTARITVDPTLAGGCASK